jgi:hypothetical protein
MEIAKAPSENEEECGHGDGTGEQLSAARLIQTLCAESHECKKAKERPQERCHRGDLRNGVNAFVEASVVEKPDSTQRNGRDCARSKKPFPAAGTAFEREKRVDEIAAHICAPRLLFLNLAKRLGADLTSIKACCVGRP